MAAITRDNVSEAIVKIVAQKVMDPLRNQMLMANLVVRDYDGDIAQKGDSVTIHLPPTLTANTISEGGSVTSQATNLGSVNVSLDTHAETTFILPDVTKALAHIDLVTPYVEAAVIALAEKIETDLLKLYTLVDAEVGASNTALTESTVDEAELTLFNAKVPEAMAKYLIVSGAAHSDLRKIARFTETQTVGDGSPIRSGQIGTIKNFTVYRSQLVQKVSNTTYNMAFARPAFALVTRPLPKPLPGQGAVAEYVSDSGFGLRVVMSYQPNTLSQQFTIDVLYGTTRVRAPFAVKVLS